MKETIKLYYFKRCSGDQSQRTFGLPLNLSSAQIQLKYCLYYPYRKQGLVSDPTEVCNILKGMLLSKAPT